MTDRELLELAAKAAGAKRTDYSDRTPDHWIIERRPRVWEEWNPLEDDGDALRLAVKLGLFTGAEFYHFRSLERFAGQEHDEFRATRRAIVRAAAEIGRQMPCQN